ncbi:MAG: NUDIX domain-containing protein [Candidatus Paceibacterota bacterium]|jgi:ADP-ribose pyrophosphatase YjhB (NUDIX family)
MDEKKLLEATLGFLVRDGKVWLAIKTRNIGRDHWNGYGGGVEPEDKNLIECLKRETQEECKVEIKGETAEKVAVIDFHNTKSDGEIFVCKVHIFLVKDWEGVPQESEEMATPTNFKIDNLPFEQMMPADKEWLPLVLEGKKLIAEYYYGPFQKELIKERKIEQIEKFPEEHSGEFRMH